jgi:acyl-homoserine lactone acylase PvdQ
MKPIAFEKFSLISSHQMQQGIFNYIHFAFKGDEKKQQIMRSAWARAIAHLQGHFATSDQGQWQWGKFHLDAARHIPFKTHPVLSKFYDRVSPGNGNLHTPNVAKMEKL